MKIQKMYFDKSPLHTINMILISELSMRNVANEHSTLSCRESEPIKEVDLLMYYAKYYVQNSLDNQDEFFNWWAHISHGVQFADGEICRNLDVLTDLFNDEKKIIIKSEDDSINDKIWDVGLHGIYIFTLKSEMCDKNSLSEDQKNRLRWIRYSVLTKIREIHSFPWAKQQSPSNRLMQIAEDPPYDKGLEFILSTASLNSIAPAAPRR